MNIKYCVWNIWIFDNYHVADISNYGHMSEHCLYQWAEAEAGTVQWTWPKSWRRYYWTHIYSWVTARKQTKFNFTPTAYYELKRKSSAGEEWPFKSHETDLIEKRNSLTFAHLWIQKLTLCPFQFCSIFFLLLSGVLKSHLFIPLPIGLVSFK